MSVQTVCVCTFKQYVCVCSNSVCVCVQIGTISTSAQHIPTTTSSSQHFSSTTTTAFIDSSTNNENDDGDSMLSNIIWTNFIGGVVIWFGIIFLCIYCYKRACAEFCERFCNLFCCCCSTKLRRTILCCCQQSTSSVTTSSRRNNPALSVQRPQVSSADVRVSSPPPSYDVALTMAKPTPGVSEVIAVKTFAINYTQPPADRVKDEELPTTSTVLSHSPVLTFVSVEHEGENSNSPSVSSRTASDSGRNVQLTQVELHSLFNSSEQSSYDNSRQRTVSGMEDNINTSSFSSSMTSVDTDLPSYERALEILSSLQKHRQTVD